MRNFKPIFVLTVVFLLGLFVAACGSAEETGLLEAPGKLVESVAAEDSGQTAAVTDAGETPAETALITNAGDTARPDGWGEQSHDNSADPNYDVVFPADEVNTLTILIDPDDWQAMLDDMTATYGEIGSGGGQTGPGNRPAGLGQPGAGADFTSENPIWVAATIQFEGDVWTDVGVRFKGNSSLMNTWSSGSLELPFKLDFDEFEDENPAIDNQRFFGFKQLSLSNNTNDATFMRDTVTADLMAEAGIASPETAYYDLYVDYGEGSMNFGLYTMIEVIDDTVIDRVFGSDDGNIYEADGSAVSLAEGTFDGITSSFQKENNEDEGDWGDIESLYTVLHSDTRQSDPVAWRAELENIFDVDVFLHWLAINTVIENWDTYGAMTHNFYLYDDPETGLLTWIPWDHNEALSEGRRSNMTLEMDGIGAEWPLISYLLADSSYYSIYVNYIDETVNTIFVAAEMAERYQAIASLIEPYATAKIGADAFAQAVQALTDHTYSRVAAADSFLFE